MNTKHTPGPWEVRNGTEKKKWERRFYVNSVNKCDKCGKSDSYQICVSLESAVGLEKAEANANLIAAAPELLDALTELLNLDTKAVNIKVWINAEYKAAQAIKKATE